MRNKPSFQELRKAHRYGDVMHPLHVMHHEVSDAVDGIGKEEFHARASIFVAFVPSW